MILICSHICLQSGKENAMEQELIYIMWQYFQNAYWFPMSHPWRAIVPPVTQSHFLKSATVSFILTQFSYRLIFSLKDKMNLMENNGSVLNITTNS